VSLAPEIKAKARTPLLWRRWGDETVVYNPASGQTHLLDLVSGEGLSCLQESFLDLGTLCERMAHRLDIENDAQLRSYVAMLLSQFEELGLLELEGVS